MLSVVIWVGAEIVILKYAFVTTSDLVSIKKNTLKKTKKSRFIVAHSFIWQNSQDKTKPTMCEGNS